MNEKEFNELLNHGETTWLEWKSDFPGSLTKCSGNPKWEEGKGTLLKDLLSIANCADKDKGFLIYGVKDEGFGRNVLGITRQWDDATFQCWARNHFDPPIKFVYSELQLNNGKTVGIFQINCSENYPHVVSKNMGDKIYEGQVWFRQGSKNTVALFKDLEDMFGEQEPLKSEGSDGQIVKQAKAYYQAQGYETVGCRLSNKDNKIAEGYKIAYYPGTRRPIWMGAMGGGKCDLILMLKPKS